MRNLQDVMEGAIAMVDQVADLVSLVGDLHGDVPRLLAHSAFGRVSVSNTILSVLLRQVDNCVEATSSSSSSAGPADASANRTTEYTYNADGNIATITAMMSSPSDDQVTTYIYGVTLADSDIASNQLLRAIAYPDSTGPSDRVEMSYNRQGELVARKDQLGTVHLYEYDGLGRRTQDRVTTLGSGVDAAVRRIATTYEVRGMVSTITSYNDAGTGTPGSVLNEVAFTYNDFGQLISDAQQHDGPVTGASLDVQYGYASGAGGSNQIRPTSLTYPNGRVIDYSYGTSGGMDDKLNRLQAIKDGFTTLAAYSHLGMGTVVRVDYTEPQVRLDLWGGTAGSYTGLDRFNRVVDLQWFDYGDSEDRVRIKHGYDRNSNRLYRRNEVARAAGASFDEHCIASHFKSPGDTSRLSCDPRIHRRGHHVPTPLRRFEHEDEFAIADGVLPGYPVSIDRRQPESRQLIAHTTAGVGTGMSYCSAACLAPLGRPMVWLAILSCRRMMPSMRVSGRGGQPGM